MNIDKRNSEGYYDPTSFDALTNVAKAEKQSAFRPLVYICSPFSGDTERNSEQARKYKANFLVDCLKGILVYQDDILNYAADADIQIERDCKYGVAVLNKEEWNPMREHQMKFLRQYYLHQRK